MPIVFAPNQIEAARVDSNGNVGIGTANPTEKLDVAGIIRSSSVIYPGGGGFQILRGMYDDPAKDRTGFTSNVYIVGYSSAVKYYGDGSALMGVTGTDATKLPLAGGTLTGGLTINNSTFTVRGPGDLMFLNSANNWGLMYINEGATQRGVLGYANGLGSVFSPGEIAGAMVMNGVSALQLGSNSTISLILSNGKTGAGGNNPLYTLDISTVNGSDPYLFRAGMDGILISTGGAIQTTGFGHGAIIGSARGLGAVDLQTSRSLITQVAFGNYSVISGGQYNTASGLKSLVAGGNDNVADKMNSAVVGGNFNKASGDFSAVIGGNNNTAAGIASFIGGGGDNQTGLGAFGAAVFGMNNAAMGNYSFSAGYKSSSAVNGTFTWADSQGVDVVNNVADQVMF
ncbi:MAG: hypothetical protein AAB359_04925, partial [Elusimicrobiota bacterium]